MCGIFFGQTGMISRLGRVCVFFWGGVKVGQVGKKMEDDVLDNFFVGSKLSRFGNFRWRKRE